MSNAEAAAPDVAVARRKASPAIRRRSAEAPAPPRGPRWTGAVQSARFRILVSYVVLLAFAGVVSILAVRQVLLLRLEGRIEAALDQEMLELDRLVADGRDPETGAPFASLADLFEVYFARNVPGTEEGMLAYVDGTLTAAALHRYPDVALPPGLLAEWARFGSRDPRGSASLAGTVDTDLGPARYRVDNVRLGDDDGAFVVTVLPAAELGEIRDFTTYGVAAAAAVLLLSTALAWPIAGRVLAPVRELTETAHSISESDLSARIRATGGSEAAEMARSFNAMLDRLEAVFRSQRQFIQAASHELRDPLTIVRGHLGLLAAEPGPPGDPTESREILDIVTDEVRRMGRIISDLEVMADIEQPDFLRMVPIDLSTFARNLLAKVRMLGDRRWVVDREATGLVLADPHRLTEAVSNLAHNAVQHTDPGGTIALGTAIDRDWWRLWVRDTGIGVPEEDRTRIFERFTRGTGASRRYRGAGLGLSIVAAIAHAHGGRVDLTSEVGQGATFTIVLPVRRPPGGA